MKHRQTIGSRAKGAGKFLAAAGTLFLLSAMPVFAAEEVPGKLMDIATNIQGILTGNFVRVILACCLCGAAIAYAYNKDNEKVKMKCIAIAIAAGILISVSGIMDWIWRSS